MNLKIVQRRGHELLALIAITTAGGFLLIGCGGNKPGPAAAPPPPQNQVSDTGPSAEEQKAQAEKEQE